MILLFLKRYMKTLCPTVLMPSIKIDEKAELYQHSAIHEFGCCVTNNIPTTYFSIVILNGKYGKYSRKDE